MNANEAVNYGQHRHGRTEGRKDERIDKQINRGRLCFWTRFIIVFDFDFYRVCIGVSTFQWHSIMNISHPPLQFNCTQLHTCIHTHLHFTNSELSCTKERNVKIAEDGQVCSIRSEANGP